jgi:anti-sigma regulatory factor (Ser/Thr protein kinase)
MAAATYLYFQLDPTLQAPREARDRTAGALRGWELPDAVEDTTIVVSELVTNAVEAMASEITVLVERCVDPDKVRVQIWDDANGEPRRGRQDWAAQRGRGLHIIDTLSDRWGHHAGVDGGKVVWAELPVSETARPTAYKAGDLTFGGPADPHGASGISFFGPRRQHLATLDVAAGSLDDLAGKLTRTLSFAGDSEVLVIASVADPSRQMRAGCQPGNRKDDSWWYVDADSGELIGPVDDPIAAARRIATGLSDPQGFSGRPRRHWTSTSRSR